MNTKTVMKKNAASAWASGLALALAGPAGAGDIAWGTATPVSTEAGNASDVSTTGTLVEAYNAANSGSEAPESVTVNGVEFITTQDLLGGDYRKALDLSAQTNGGDEAYDTLLSTADFGANEDTVPIVVGDGDGNASVTGPGLLSVGSRYEVQVWYVDDRNEHDARVQSVASAEGAAEVELNDQFVIGTFTATETTQTLFFQTPAPKNFNNVHLTAYQIRLISQEEPR